MKTTTALASLSPALCCASAAHAETFDWATVGAAYYDPRLEAAGGSPGDDNYWLYPTQNDTAPTAEAPPGGTNSANFDFVVGHDTTDVGAYTGTTSFYGTFDQAGNLWEWNEAVISSSFRGVRGGGWFNGYSSRLAASYRIGDGPTLRSSNIGFRVASIPVPIGDFDEDYDIDGADFLYWQLNDGSESNLTVWQDQFGQSASTTATIPEPSTLLLAMLGMASACCWRRRR